MLKVVIIDDNFEFVESLFNILTSKAKNIQVVKIFSDGDKAINYILNENVDVILLDLNMPKLNGIQVIEKIKNNNKNVNIITMTGDNSLMIELLKRNLRVEMNLIKPFKIEELINVLYELDEKEITPTRKKIIRILDNFNFNKNNIGYFYIIESIEYCINNEYKCMPSCKTVFSYIAKKHNCSNYLRVGWNIDKSIKTMYKLTDDFQRNDLFKFDLIPSTKNFLNFILDKIYRN